MEQRNAVISKVSISNADHGCLTVWVYLDYGGSGQGFGGYCLLNVGCKPPILKGTAGHFINRVMEVSGVTNWNDVEGKAIRVKYDYDKVHEIGHIIKDDWFNPSEDFKDLK